MVSFVQAAVVAAALLTGSNPTARSRSFDGGSHHLGGDLDRLIDLMAPLAKAVLASSSPQELEDNLEEQLLSGLFSDIVMRSAQTVARHPDVGETSEFDETFLAAIETLGGGRCQAEEALRLSKISMKLSMPLVRAVADNDDLDLDSLRIDPSELLYDVEIPVEILEAVHANFVAAICVFTLAHAIATKIEPPRWLIAELVERWFKGQKASLPILAASINELALGREGQLPGEVMIELDRIRAQELFGIPDLTAAWQRTEAMNAHFRAIAEHAARQIDGVWPKS
jgi:hypothetical protein